MRTWVRWAALGLAVAAGVGCATEADPAALDEVVTEGGDTGATGAGFLAAAGEQSSAEAYRLSMRMSLSMSGVDDDAGESYGFDGEVLTGAQDGDAYDLHLDMTGPMADMGLEDSEALGAGDLSMDVVGDGETLYLRAPMFGALASAGDDEPAEEWMADVSELGDRWGRVDLTSLDDSVAGVQGSLAAPGMGDPAAMLDLLGEVSETEDLGTEVIDGVEAHGTRFVVPLTDVLRESGGAGEPAGDEGMAAFAEAMLGDVPVEAWVDGDGYVRRMSYEIDMGEVVDALAEDEGFTMVMGATIDFSDYGDPGIEITFPEEADTVDITEAFEHMAEGD